MDGDADLGPVLDKAKALPDAAARMNSIFRYAQVGRCVNGVTHDINNYLGAIMAYAELILLDEGINVEAQRMLGEIIEGASKCNALITALTAIARKDQSLESLVDPAGIAKRVLLLRAYDMRVKRIKLETRLEEPVPSIIGDAAKLQLALLYLVFNAEEAVAELPERLIRVSAYAMPGGVAAAVWNSGPPFSPEMQQQLFTPYATAKDAPHIGLGLCAAQEIATLHGGSVSYAPDTGFVLYLPLKESEV